MAKVELKIGEGIAVKFPVVITSLTAPLQAMSESEGMDMNAVFTQFRDKLDAHYDRRERLVKISRDITAHSKKMIFSLQRVQGEVTALPPNIRKEVENREAEIQTLLEKAGLDLLGPNADR